MHSLKGDAETLTRLLNEAANNSSQVMLYAAAT